MPTKDTPGEGQTFEQQVMSVVSKFTTDDKGELVIPDDIKDLPEPIMFAAKAEKRRRDTQSAFTRTQQRNKELEKEQEALSEKLQTFALSTLTQEQTDELETLKRDNPDQWRVRLNELETAARTKLKDEAKTITTKARAETEIQRRERVMEEFTKANPTVVINDEVIANEIPPRFAKQLESGEITFEGFLDKCKQFLTAGKVIEKVKDPKTGKIMDDVGGHATPPESEVNKAAIKTYKTETY